MLGISRTTVARALKEGSSIKEETRQRVLELMEKTNYQKNYFGSSLAGKTKIVHAFIVKSKNEFYTNEIRRGIQNIRKKYEKYRVEVQIYTHEINFPEEQTKAVEALLEGQKQIDGILIVPLERKKLYSILKSHIHEIPVFSLSIPLHKSIAYLGVDYHKQGRMVAEILGHCLRKGETLVVLDNGDDHLSTNPYLEGFLERISKNKEIRLLGPYSCQGVEESVALLQDLEKKEKIVGIFSNRYAQNIVSSLPDSFLQGKKIVLNGMGPNVKKLLRENKIIATVMEEVYEQAYLAGKLVFQTLYEEKQEEVIWRRTNSKIVYLENLEEN